MGDTNDTSGRTMQFIFGVLFCTVLMGGAGLSALLTSVARYRTNAWMWVEGTMITSKLATHPKSEGGTYTTAEIKYRYVVAGGEYESDRILLHGFAFSENASRKFVAAHPAGSAIGVFYNPARPGEASLMQGLQGSDLFMWIFVTPFQVFVIAVWVFWLWNYRKRFGMARGHYDERPQRLIVRPSYGWSVVWFAGALALSSVAMIFVGFFFGGDEIQFERGQLLMAINFGIAGVVGGVHAAQTAIGKRDIIFDDSTRTLHLPKGMEILYSNIRWVGVITDNSFRVFKRVVPTYNIWLELPIKESKGINLAAWRDDREAALALAQRLSTRTGAPVIEKAGRRKKKKKEEVHYFDP